MISTDRGTGSRSMMRAVGTAIAATPTADDDAAQVGQARESPDAAVEAEAPERRDVHCDHRGERLDGVLEKRFRRYLEVEAEPERGQPGDNARDDVVGESGHAAPVDSHGAALRSAATGCRRRQARPTAAMSAR